MTIEDLLEEIVGEIRDEYDVETEPIVDEGNGSFVFSAKVNIDEVRDRLGVEIEPDGFETVGGYVLTRVGRVPAVGESFELDGLQVEVLEAERRRIHKVRVRLRGDAGRRRKSSAEPDEIWLRLVHRPPECGQIHAAQPHHRHQGRHCLRQAADDADRILGGQDLRRRADRVRRHARASIVRSTA